MNADQLRILLLVILGLPLVAGVVIALLPRASLARPLSIGLALLHLVLTGVLVGFAAPQLVNREIDPKVVFQPEFVPGVAVNPTTGEINFPHKTTFNLIGLSPIPADTSVGGIFPAIQFYIGLDGINIWLVALTSVMMVPVILMIGNSIQDRANKFYAWLFLLQTAILGVFLSFDLILFYVFFELTLIPLFFLIGQWGNGAGRRDAARKFFLYTLAGSLLTLVGAIGIVLSVYSQTKLLTFSIPELAQYLRQAYATLDPAQHAYWWNVQTFSFLMLVAGFAVKIPLIPFHSWLPSAYSEAPASVTVLLSALLAKMGTFGLVRICFPFTPDATLHLGMPLLGLLGVIGIVFGALCAYAQTDLKRMIAYSSISHLGFCVLALVAFNTEGMSGGILHMVNHGLSTGALFVLVGLMVDRYGSQPMDSFSGLWNKLPVFTFFMIVMTLASVGLPGLNNFVSEMLMLGSLFDLQNKSMTSLTFAILAGFGIFLSAWYMLTMIQRVFFGPLREPDMTKPVTDLNRREWLTIAPLGVLCLVLGLFPQPVLNVINKDVEALSKVADEARARQ